MRFLSQQRCGLEQANHRKQMSINHINPTGHWDGTSTVACMFILLTRGQREQSKEIIPCSFLHLIWVSLQMPVIPAWFYATQNLLWSKMDACICISEITWSGTDMKMKISSAVIAPMKCILTDMFGHWTMDYYYKPRLKHASQRSMWGMGNFKVMFQAYQGNRFVSFVIWFGC